MRVPIFSRFGLVLYEMLSGRRAFGGRLGGRNHGRHLAQGTGAAARRRENSLGWSRAVCAKRPPTGFRPMRK